jgi:hypothetical protein
MVRVLHVCDRHQGIAQLIEAYVMNWYEHAYQHFVNHQLMKHIVPLLMVLLAVVVMMVLMLVLISFPSHQLATLYLMLLLLMEGTDRGNPDPPDRAMDHFTQQNVCVWGKVDPYRQPCQTKTHPSIHPSH